MSRNIQAEEKRTKAFLKYERMVDEGIIKEKDSLDVDLLAPERRTDEYLTEVYNRCVELKKPWYDIIKLDYEYKEGCLY